MGWGDTFLYALYTSDDGEQYIVKLSSATSTEGGFTPEPDPLAAPGWPYGPHNMRHVCGESAGGKRATLPIALPSSTMFVDGGSFTIHGTSYTITSMIGERRDVRNLGN